LPRRSLGEGGKVGPCTGVEYTAESRKPFVREFVRPNGLDVPATPLFVDYVESMAALTPAAARPARFAALWRSLAERVARTRDDERYETWTLSEREMASLENLRAARQVKARERRKARETAREANEQARAVERAAKERERADAERAAGRQRAG